MTRTVRIDINGRVFQKEIDVRMLLSDFIRFEARLTGTNVGCEHGVCGTCTVHLDDVPIRSCLALAVEANGHFVRTVEALSQENGGSLHPLQKAFSEKHALQCGFCTPGLLMTLEPLLGDGVERDAQAVRGAIAGNLCRCTGYQQIVEAAMFALHQASIDATDTEGEQLA